MGLQPNNYRRQCIICKECDPKIIVAGVSQGYCKIIGDYNFYVMPQNCIVVLVQKATNKILPPVHVNDKDIIAPSYILFKPPENMEIGVYKVGISCNNISDYDYQSSAETEVMSKENYDIKKNVHCQNMATEGIQTFIGNQLYNLNISYYTRDALGQTALHRAAYFGQFEKVVKLIDEGYSVLDLDNFKRTPYHIACAAGQIEIAEYISKKNTKVMDCMDVFGEKGIDLLKQKIEASNEGKSEMNYENQNLEIIPLDIIKYRKKINNLNLRFNKISNISTLTAFMELKTLKLDGNHIECLYPLENLTKLEELHLSSNNIEDLSPLAFLDELKVLILSKNRIKDLTSLQNLSKLEELDLSKNDH